MKSIWIKLATLGPIGYLYAPGTCATAVTLGVVYALSLLSISSYAYLAFMLVAIVAGWLIITKALARFDRCDDPSEIVFDEFLGCLLTFWDIPLTVITVLIGFLLFRILDITKAFGIRSFEMILGAWGIILDDLAAGFLTNIFLRLMLHFFYAYII
ncbi:MAG: phosphatidylglycerophosphatase A [Candidatus Dependentiae bacterium]|nr:phosphatidylglycerophosphatase A [Candidatus Dependentiae bacterium]